MKEGEEVGIVEEEAQDPDGQIQDGVYHVIQLFTEKKEAQFELQATTIALLCILYNYACSYNEVVSERAIFAKLLLIFCYPLPHVKYTCGATVEHNTPSVYCTCAGERV